MAFSYRTEAGFDKGLLQNSFTISESAIENKQRPGLTPCEARSFREGYKPVPILGHCSIRFLGFIGASSAAILALLNFWLTALTHPWDLLDTILLLIFSLSAAIVEATSFGSCCCCGCFVRLRFKIEYWAKFFSRAWGKFIVYELIASFLLTWRAGLVWIVVGIFNTIIGLSYLFYSIYGSWKLKGVRKHALRIYRDHFEDLFDEVDVDGDNYLNPHEIDLLADRLGLSLSPNEIQVMVNFLDTDRDGKISVKEFKMWFEENKLPTLV